jgi:hypothetical protein
MIGSGIYIYIYIYIYKGSYVRIEMKHIATSN